MYAMPAFGGNIDGRVRHVSFVAEQWIRSGFLGNANILSFLHVGYNDFRGVKVTKSRLQLLLENCRNLKALDLSGLLFKSFPSIGKLSLLRYLNLSWNTEIEVLPDKITTLRNLQTFILEECVKLKRLPNDFSRLTQLRLLNIRGCSSLTCMPKGIGNLTLLHRLTDFVVGDKGSHSSWTQLFDALKDLKPLDNLRGCLHIETRCPNAKYASKEDAMRGGLYPMQNKKDLKAIEFYFKQAEVQWCEKVTALMKELEPHRNLQYLKVWRYNGVSMGWDTFPANLVELDMIGCWELKFLPCLGNLPRLKVLKLSNLKKLECIITQDIPLANSSSAHKSSEGFPPYYPSLETPQLENLPMLKGWRRVAVDDHLRRVPIDGGGSSSSNSDNEGQWQLLLGFSQLKSLFIWNCKELTWIPSCPAVEELKLVHFNNTLRIVNSTARGEHLVDVASSSAFCNDIDIPESSSRRSHIQNAKKIRKVTISNVAWLNWLPIEAFECLENLRIWCDNEVESLEEVEEVFRSCSSTLKLLVIHNCRNLKSVFLGGLKDLTSLEKLELRNCDNLTLSEEEEEQEEEREDGIDIALVKWSSNFHALRSLKLEGLPLLMNLPDWMQFLPTLKTLCICYCCGLESMPSWITKLTYLKQLAIISCLANLEKICKEEGIPNIEFRNCGF